MREALSDSPHADRIMEILEEVQTLCRYSSQTFSELAALLARTAIVTEWNSPTFTL